MNKIRKTLGFILAAAMIVSCFSGMSITSFAEDEVMIAAAPPPSFAMDTVMPDDVDPAVDWDGVFAAISKGIEEHSEAIDLSSFGISLDDIGYISNYIYDTPEFLWSIRYSYSYSGGKLFSIIPFYTYSATEYASMIEECEDAVTQLLYGIRDNSSLSDIDKCLLLHDRLAQWCEYDYENLLKDSVPDVSHSAYGALALHVAVCQGYAYAYIWLLNELGIESYYISSDMINHGWVMVVIDSEPYFVDVTWDDPTIDLAGRATHKNFMQSFSTFSAGHEGAYDFTDEPDSTKYESYTWSASDTAIVNIGGTFYYIDKTAQKLMSTTSFASGTTPVVVKDLSSYKWTIAGGAYYPGCYSSLTQVGDKLFYSTPSEIRAYDPANSTDTLVYAPELPSYNWIYGFNQIDGTLNIVVSGSPNLSLDSYNDYITHTFCDHANKDTLKTITAATCTSTGTEKYICADCRAIGTATTDMAAHTWSDGKCTECQTECTHVDADDNGICDVCEKVLKTAPAEVPANADALTVSARTASTVTLSWNAAEGADHYRVYRYDSATKTNVAIGYTTSKLTYKVTGLTAGTTYTFRIRPFSNATGKNVYSESYTSVSTTTLPANVTDFIAAAKTDSSVTLTWTKVDGATGYNIYRYNKTTAQNDLIGTTKNSTYTDTGLDDGTQYTYRIKAFRTYGGQSYESASFASYSVKTNVTGAPENAAGLTVSSKTDSKVTLKWSAAEGATHYRIYRYDTAAKTNTAIGYTKSLSYTVTGLDAGTTYTFNIRPFSNATGKNIYSANYTGVTITTPEDGSVPANAEGLAVASQTDTTVTLTWNTASGATHYRIYRYDETLKQNVAIAYTTAGKTEYTVKGLTAGTAYKFSVRPFSNESGSNIYSPAYTSVTVTTNS